MNFSIDLLNCAPKIIDQNPREMYSHFYVFQSVFPFRGFDNANKDGVQTNAYLWDVDT